MKLFGIALALVAACVGLYMISYPTYSCRYRLTINVEVDGRLRSASSVVEYRISRQPKLLPDVNSTVFDTVGEAVFIDINGLGLVALLTSGDYGQDNSVLVRRIPAHFKLNVDRQAASLSSLRGKWELGEDDLPTLVACANPNDSTTLRVIKPNELEHAFGPNVHWRGAVIEMTTDPVSHNLAAQLPFLVSQEALLRKPYGNPSKFIPNYRMFVRS
jgi:hypothetical protein